MALPGVRGKLEKLTDAHLRNGVPPLGGAAPVAGAAAAGGAGCGVSHCVICPINAARVNGEKADMEQTLSALNGALGGDIFPHGKFGDDQHFYK